MNDNNGDPENDNADDDAAKGEGALLDRGTRRQRHTIPIVAVNASNIRIT